MHISLQDRSFLLATVHNKTPIITSLLVPNKSLYWILELKRLDN